LPRTGRPPKAPEQKALEGRVGANLVVLEPKTRPVAPSIPGWLSVAAKRVWRALAPELERAGLLSVVDGPVFAAFCEAAAEAQQLSQLIEKEGRTYTTPTGQIKPRPEVVLLRFARRELLSFAAEIGLTPAARKRMAVLVDRGVEHVLDDLLD
jgi:P27 family predicted phage terminase small subunit